MNKNKRTKVIVIDAKDGTTTIFLNDENIFRIIGGKNITVKEKDNEIMIDEEAQALLEYFQGQLKSALNKIRTRNTDKYTGREIVDLMEKITNLEKEVK